MKIYKIMVRNTNNKELNSLEVATVNAKGDALIILSALQKEVLEAPLEYFIKVHIVKDLKEELSTPLLGIISRVSNIHNTLKKKHSESLTIKTSNRYDVTVEDTLNTINECLTNIHKTI